MNRIALALVLSLVAGGCLTRRTEMTAELDAASARPAFAPSVPPRPAAGEPAVEGPAVAEIRRRQSEWLSTIGDPPTVVRFIDLGSPEAAAVGRWAGDAARVREALGRAVDVRTLALLAFARNPDVARALESWRAVLVRYDQAVSFDDVLAQYNAFARELSIPFGPMGHRGKEPIGESIPPPGTLARKGDVVDAEARIARDRYRLAVRELITEVRKTAYQIEYLDRSIRITRDNQKTLSDLVGVVRVKYESGGAQYAHVLQAQAELDEIDDRLITLGTLRATAVARLSYHLDLPGPTAVGAIETPAPDPVAAGRSLADLQAGAIADSQSLDVLRARIAMVESAIRLAEDRTYYKYIQRLYLFDHRAGREGMARPMEPVPYWFGQMDSFLGEMRQNLVALRQELAEAENGVRFAVERAYWEVDAKGRLVGLYEGSLVGRARQSLEANRSGYEAGRVSFLDVLDAERKLFRFELSQEMARRDLLQERAELQRHLGRSLP